MGVVAAVTAHVAKHNGTTFAAAYPGGATPAQLGAAVGYPGKASSALRAHVARNLQQGTKQQGITRYPPLGYSAWCKLLQVAERTAQAQPGSKAQQAQQGQAAKLWQQARKARSAGNRGARQAKGKAQGSKPAAVPAAVADATAQAQANAATYSNAAAGLPAEGTAQA